MRVELGAVEEASPQLDDHLKRVDRENDRHDCRNDVGREVADQLVDEVRTGTVQRVRRGRRPGGRGTDENRRHGHGHGTGNDGLAALEVRDEREDSGDDAADLVAHDFLSYLQRLQDLFPRFPGSL